MENLNKKDRGNIEIGLIIVSVAVLAVFIIFMVLNPETTIRGIGGFFNKMISGLGPVFEVVAFVTFLIGLYPVSYTHLRAHAT